MKNLFIIISVLILFLITSAVAQNQNESVTNLVNTLKQKVLLNDDQASSIQKVINDLITKSKAAEDKNELIKEAQTKVESYLDKRQMIKYEIIKNDWWKQIQTIL